MKHTLSVLVEDESGVLTRIAGLFARRGTFRDNPFGTICSTSHLRDYPFEQT